MTKRRRQFGFTLIELVLILLLIAVCAAISAPSLAGFSRARTLPHTATDLVSTANWCRVKALSDGVEYRLNLDAANNMWFVSKDRGDGTFVQVTDDMGKQYNLLEGVTFSDVQFKATPDARKDQGLYVSFLPGGRTDVVEITLTREGSSTVVGCEMPMATFHILKGVSQ